ncbi:hypothetical protein [Pantanalinema sp. GBBB05]|uniref:hypothetical protein n=1 Tax=Pantanalinema sp. GBBB05 TaxID=2604139 RepID=UPI001DAB397A|nr:hypothetical protein [Pantanalinema sp. GBBB05]
MTHPRSNLLKSLKAAVQRIILAPYELSSPEPEVIEIIQWGQGTCARCLRSYGIVLLFLTVAIVSSGAHNPIGLVSLLIGGAALGGIGLVLALFESHTAQAYRINLKTGTLATWSTAQGQPDRATSYTLLQPVVAQCLREGGRGSKYFVRWRLSNWTPIGQTTSFQIYHDHSIRVYIRDQAQLTTIAADLARLGVPTESGRISA